jgi:ribosomal-protein-alanine N-acetyltransferase
MILSPPLSYRLRPMRLEDVDDVMAVERRSFPMPWPAAGYRHELTNNARARYVVLTWVEEQEERHFIGYAGYWIVAGEAHISTLAVDRPWRGRGLGALLLLQIIYDALHQEARVVSLEVRESNEAAQRLYKSYGFQIVGRRKGYYRKIGEDAILMDLDLLSAGLASQIEEKRKALWKRLRQEGTSGAGPRLPAGAS